MKLKHQILGSLAILFVFQSCVNSYRWTSIGDSITSQNGKKYQHPTLKGKKANGYQDVMISKIDTPIHLTNKGMSGFSLAGTDSSIYLSLKDYDFRNEDLITILVGTNDFKKNKPILSVDSLNSFTYCFRELISKIKEHNSFCKVYLITPLMRNKDGYTTTSVNKAGYKLDDYRKVVIEMGREFNLPVIDLYNESGINESNLSIYTYDGLHPNNEGYKKIAETLLREIVIE